jgi:hypothetical protein
MIQVQEIVSSVQSWAGVAFAVYVSGALVNLAFVIVDYILLVACFFVRAPRRGFLRINLNLIGYEMVPALNPWLLSWGEYFVFSKSDENAGKKFQEYRVMAFSDWTDECLLHALTSWLGVYWRCANFMNVVRKFSNLLFSPSVSLLDLEKLVKAEEVVWRLTNDAENLRLIVVHPSKNSIVKAS